jgi:hypothetical protein
MATIQDNYIRECNTPSDIFQHLPTLYKYAKECNHITECGVRGVVSSWAFAYGLLGRSPVKLIQTDPGTNQNVVNFGETCNNNGIPCTFYNESDLTCPMEATDLLFIDTWHVYAQLKRELGRWNEHVRKYIILHDTTVDEWQGETIRNGWNAKEQSNQFGFPVHEINMGLWPAVVEFLAAHPEWILEKRYTNNNGLTILKRIA